MSDVVTKPDGYTQGGGLAMGEKLDAFLHVTGINLLPYQRLIFEEMLKKKECYICMPPNVGRTDFRMLQACMEVLYREGEE